LSIPALSEGILDVGDIPDVVAVLAPRPLLMTGTLDGVDRLVTVSELPHELQPVYEAYGAGALTAGSLTIRCGEEKSNFAEWFIQENR
jgi:hypothetical protein